MTGIMLKYLYKKPENTFLIKFIVFLNKHAALKLLVIFMSYSKLNIKIKQSKKKTFYNFILRSPFQLKL